MTWSVKVFCRLCDNRIVYIWKEFDLCLSQTIDSMSAALCHGKEKWKISIFFVCFSPGKDSAHWSDVFSLQSCAKQSIVSISFLFIFSTKIDSFSCQMTKKVRQQFTLWGLLLLSFIHSLRHCIYIVSIGNTCGELLSRKSFLIECNTI